MAKWQMHEAETKESGEIVQRKVAVGFIKLIYWNEFNV